MKGCNDPFLIFTFDFLLSVMKNLFDQATYEEVKQRMDQLTPSSERRWGKMAVAQMMAHCKEAFRVPLSDTRMPRSIMGILLGWAFKSKLYDETPWKQNLPTAPQFKVKDDRDFNKEKNELTELVDQFYHGGPANTGKFPHPMFGSFTSEQWGMSMYKHLDHHLRQFGV